MASAREMGRTRVVLTVVLALLIGALGAILLPRLLGKAVRSGAGPVHGHVCFVVPEAGTIRDGNVAIAYDRGDERGPVWSSYGAAAGSSVADLRAGIAWMLGRTREGATDASDNCLPLGRVVAVGAVLGRTGAGVSLGLAGSPGEPLTLLWKVEGPDDLEGSGAFRLSLDASGEGAAVAALSVPWNEPAAVRAALAKKLSEDGWGVDDSDPAALRILHLPGGAPIASALFTVRHEEGDAGKVPAGTYTWTLSVAR